MAAPSDVREEQLTADQRRAIQAALQYIGTYQGRIDGDLGPGTRAAIKIVQRARGLPDTGMVDQALLDFLRSQKRD